MITPVTTSPKLRSLKNIPARPAPTTCVIALEIQSRRQIENIFVPSLKAKSPKKTAVITELQRKWTIARLPRVARRCCVEPGCAVTNQSGGSITHARYVSVIETTFIETLVGIIRGANVCPLERRYQHPANDSHAAATIAAGPPYIRNIRKTAASVKLIAKRDLGNARLIRGAISTENRIIRKNAGPGAYERIVQRAKTSDIAPSAMIKPLATFV